MALFLVCQGDFCSVDVYALMMVNLLWHFSIVKITAEMLKESQNCCWLMDNFYIFFISWASGALNPEGSFSADRVSSVKRYFIYVRVENLPFLTLYVLPIEYLSEDIHNRDHKLSPLFFSPLCGHSHFSHGKFVC